MSTWLVVGLGNPGPTYASHRHNVGYRVVDELAARAGAGFSTLQKLRAEVCQTRITPSGEVGGFGPVAARVVLMKSRTYMNETGLAVERTMAYFNGAPEFVIAVHDELDLDPGRIRLKFGGGDNGHNGLKSMRRCLGTGDFFRVRVGIGRPIGSQAPADYVLSTVPAAQREDFAVDVARAADAVTTLISQGLDQAQNTFNS